MFVSDALDALAEQNGIILAELENIKNMVREIKDQITKEVNGK